MPSPFWNSQLCSFFLDGAQKSAKLTWKPSNPRIRESFLHHIRVSQGFSRTLVTSIQTTLKLCNDYNHIFISNATHIFCKIHNITYQNFEIIFQQNFSGSLISLPRNITSSDLYNAAVPSGNSRCNRKATCVNSWTQLVEKTSKFPSLWHGEKKQQKRRHLTFCKRTKNIIKNQCTKIHISSDPKMIRLCRHVGTLRNFPNMLKVGKLDAPTRASQTSAMRWSPKALRSTGHGLQVLDGKQQRIFCREVFVRDGKNIGIYVEISKVEKNQSIFFLKIFGDMLFWNIVSWCWLLPFGHFQCDFCAAMRMDLSLCSKPTIQCNDKPPTSNSWNFTIHYVKYTTGFKTTRFIGSPKQNSRVSVSR